MTPYSDPWGASRQGRTETRTGMWSGFRDYAIPGQYAGSYADRQSRFYLRSLRRDGLFFVDFPPVLLWFDYDWAAVHGYCW